jgi:hypothetical protein
MSKQKLVRLFSMATSLALVLSLAFTANVIADDATPPPVTEETGLPPTEELVPPSTEPAPTELPPTAETGPTVSELMSGLPENTALVLTIDNEAVPLVTEEAAAAILIGDPIWCPEGVLPDPNVNGCTDSYPDLESLIDDIDNSVIPEPSANGTIWIMAGADASISDIEIDGSIFTNWSNFNLTLQGGWDGTATGNVSGTSDFSVSLSVINWSGSVTLNQIAISNTAGTGLEVSTDGDIVLEDVSSSDNDSYGAELNSTSGSITLNGINAFNNNVDSGLYADANGDIQAENVTASDNGAYGAELYSLNDVVITGTNIFTGNLDSGVYAEADGNIEAEKVTASSNDGNGAEFNSMNDVILTGTSEFSDNGNSGLYVEAGNNINTENITANGNGGSGAELYSMGDITVNGTNAFSDNTDFGLYAEADGDINVENITANGNGINGSELYATGVSVKGSNIFTGNEYSGLYIEASGDIYTENITADGNGASGIYGSGVELYTTGLATAAGTNAFTNNYADGLFIDTDGNIFIYDSNANGNGGSGIFIESISNAEITCGVLSNNASYEIEADLVGTLTLNGVDFGGDIDGELGVDEDYLILNSNNCFTYPSPVDDNDDGSDTSTDSDSDDDTDSDVSINLVSVTNGQPVILDCETYEGTLITLANGDGALIPCPIIDLAQLFEIPADKLPDTLPENNVFVSSFLLTILENGQKLGPLNLPGAIWYASPEQIQNGEVKAVYWNGVDWETITDEITPYMNVFFRIPEELKGVELAILYWDGFKWIELSESGHLGDGYIVKTPGHVSADGIYFEATLNFTGTFVLVKK